MLKYVEMENLVLHREVMAFPMMPKNKGLAILLNTTEPNAFNFMTTNKRIRNTKYIKAYYKDFRYVLKVFNKGVNYKIEQSEVYEQVESAVKSIQYTYRNIENYKLNNVYVGLDEYNKIFFEKKGKVKGDRVITEYLNMIKKATEKYSDYTHKVMVIDLIDWLDDPKANKSYLYTNANTPFTIFYSAMLRHFDLFKALPFEILFLYGRYKIRVIPSQCDEKSYALLKATMTKMMMPKDANFFEEGEENKADEVVKKDEIDEKKAEVVYGIKDKINDVVPSVTVVHKFTGDGASIDIKDTTDVDELTDKIKEVVDKKIEEDEDIDEEELEKKTKEELNKDEEFLAKLDAVTSNTFTNVSFGNSKRNELLQKNQAKIKINKQGKTIDEILNDSKAKKLEPKKLKLDTLNTDLQEMNFIAFTETYNKNLLEKDTLGIINFFSKKRIPVYILDIKKEDTSTEFDKKVTYTIKMESADRERHTLKFDMPKFVDNSFLYLGGNKKNILNQLFLKPVVKTGPDTVQLCTNYNKIFMKRRGSRLSPKLERMKKALSMYNGVNMRSKIYYKTGDNSLINTPFLTNIEYDEMANTYLDLYINGNGQYHFFFNQNQIRDMIKELGLKFDANDDYLPVAIKDRKEIIYLDVQKDVIKGTQDSLLDYIINVASKPIPEFKKEFDQINVGKKYLYTEATIMKRKIPILLLLAYLEGLTTVLKKAGVKYYFSDKRDRLDDGDKSNKEIIQFSDGYLIYDRYPMKNSLLLNAFSLLPTKDYSYTDFDNKETYLDIFDMLYGNKMILNAFENFYDLFIDPITAEVLDDLNLPNDFVSLVLYGNELLQDNQFTKENDMSLYRLRNNELVNAYLYQVLADAYAVYRSSAGNKHPKKMSIPQDAVLKEIVMSQIVEDYSTLNPILEAEKLRAGTFKGPSGLNQERSYTLEKRSYDKSMKGIFAMSSPPSGSVGLVRQLAMDVNVISPRGYLKVTDDMDDLNSANMFCPSELLTPGCAQHDDSPRVAMTTTQTKHVVPAKRYDELLITNGADEALAQVISNDFAFKAKEDGKVVEKDLETGVIVLEYKNGEHDIIDTSNNIAKNGGGGFYINNKLECDLSVGQKFKQGDVIATNKKFFNNHDGSAIYKSGTLAKIAIMSGYYTYEDSAMITKKLSKDMTAEVCQKQDVVIGKNSNIGYIVKIGDHVEVGDPLVTYDDSYEDESINKLLANMNKGTRDQLLNMGKIPKKSHYSGTIVDIKVYYTTDLSELSPSLRKTINEINSINKKKRSVIEKYTKIESTTAQLEPVSKVEAKYGKVKGVDVGEGVLIEFYIAYEYTMGVGDKLTMFTALKSVVCKVVPEGQEPYSEHRPNEEVSAFLSPISELARMTKSIEQQMFGNKILIELKYIMQDIMNEK